MIEPFILLGMAGGWMRRGRSRWIAGAAMVGVVTAAAFSIIGHQVNTVPVGAPTARVLSLITTRDLGALPPSGTDDGGFCGSVGTLGQPTHCYKMDEVAGDLTDYGTGGLTLTAGGVPRYGVVAGVPVAGAPLTFAERGIASDGSGRFTGSKTANAKTSITVVWRARRHTATHYLFDWGYAGTAGFDAAITNAGRSEEHTS